MTRHTLDSFALLAYLRGEPGADQVQELLEKAGRGKAHVWMCEVNYAEVQYITLRKSGIASWERVSGALKTLPIDFVPTTLALADQAAKFKAGHKLSLADAFAAALAKDYKAELVTGDSEFQALSSEIRIAWLE